MKSNNKKYNRIKIVLVEQERSSKWLAEKIDKDKSTVSRWCTNDMQPSLETLFQIAEILGVSVAKLLHDNTNVEN
ncbi:helix-turn-helix transcriptional regulator [Aestuariibaculum marinum]|uniref:Helix-turn-helix transcriptional regulator n=1 Tax=Aestuariibaculum marinum TaxID=2683592 RepID=A0A8J6U358_9FLAO|nr:helix-turn-helix domain-containing protein [Aestuariibaculum marinum]MBD0822792.1 helix-turn-helix transcriptional regulator [Aestuariibaculum marinum]